MRINKVAAVALVCLVAGCGKDEGVSLPEVYPAENHAYMKDPEFKAQLGAQVAEREAILGVREEIIAEYEALEKRAGSPEAAQTNAAFAALERRMRACEQAFESNRLESARLVDARMARARRDSERIARGEARAKEISK